jgi:long-chain acyl-CoA synthetase
MDVVNQLALGTISDEEHGIYFSRDGPVESMSLAELDRRAHCIAYLLRERGVGKGCRVGITAVNCIEWVLLDLAILKLGGVTVGFDAGRFDAVSALQRYGLHSLFVEESTKNDSCILSIRQVWGWGSGAPSHARAGPFHGGYGPEEACAIKFTSGSTGAPKGMEATVAGINDSLTAVQEMFHHSSDDHILVFLRLAQLQQRYWYYSALAFGHDVTITSLDNVFSMAQAVHPTVIMGVPGFFEDVKRILESNPDIGVESPTKRSEAIQALFGGRIRYLWTGSAPASRATLDFYEESRVPLYQGYGLNETCIVAKNYPGGNRTGSVGRILPGKTVRFDERGMLIVGSRHPIVKRYAWCSPEDNKRIFLPSGEVVTHDLAYLDHDQYLYILGRVDDEVVLTTGRNVLIGPIEERISNHPKIHKCVLYGHGKPFLTAVISPATDYLDRREMESHLAAINKGLFPEQQVCGLVIAPERFSIENDLLTSQFKPVRKAIFERFATNLDAIYAEAGGSSPWRGRYGQ